MEKWNSRPLLMEMKNGMVTLEKQFDSLLETYT